MLPLLLALVAAPPDTTPPFANEATRALIERAIARHATSDHSVRDYLARFRYRLSFGLGRRRWAEVPNAAVEEQEGTVQWAQPNDLRVDILGRRAAARSNTMRLNSTFDQPWFFPRGLGDSIRVFGNDVPPRAAIHPLAAGAPEWYRYAVTDSVQYATTDGRRVKLIAVEVLPRKKGAALVAGRLWFDAAEADLARISFRFVGTELWVDPDEPDRDAKRINRIVSRVLTLDADLEYALQGERYWMPYRQTVSGRVELPWLGELVVPFEARTTFEDYEINSGRPLVFLLPPPDQVSDPDSLKALAAARRDSLRTERRRRRDGSEIPEDSLPRDDAGWWQNGRYEIHRAPADSLAGYGAWGDDLTLGDDAASDRAVREIQSDLERMAVDLPRELTGRPGNGFTWERLPERVRFNRVQGAAPGLGYEWNSGFTTLRADARFGFSDERVMAGVAVIREAPGARWTLRGQRDLASSDPFGRGNGFGNSLNALFAGHDDADYHLVHGGSLRRESALGTGIELSTTLRVEHQQSVRRESRNWLNDALGGTGRYPGNPPIEEGTFGGAEVRLDGGLFRSRWSLATDLLANEDRGTVRVWGTVRRALWTGRSVPTLTLRAGITSNDPLPQQAFRLGGQETVRGFDYGTRRGQALWAAQVDWPVSGGFFRPYLFIDAGQAAPASGLFRTRLLSGGGAGLGLFGGLLRFDLSHPISEGGSGLRFDLVVRSLFQ